MVKPIICFDLDGTIVDEMGRIHPDDIEILRTESRVTFIPATGRPRRAIRQVFERNGLFSTCQIPFPMILQNGAVLYKPNEELHTVNAFEPKTQTRLLKIARSYIHIASKWFTPEQIYVQHPNEIALRMAQRYDLEMQPFSQAPKSPKFIKATFMANSAENLQPFKAATSDLRVERYFSIPEILEINAPGVGKGQMLAVLKAELGWNDAPTFVAGDGENDLSLFKQATLTFCPDNCPATIKSQADQIIDVKEAGLLSPLLTIIFSDRI